MITKIQRLTVYLSALILVFFSIIPVSASAQSASGELVWSKLASMDASNLNDIVVNNNHTYVAVGDEGTILRSNDGRQWQSVDSTTIENIHAVTTNGTTFVAVGNNGTILSSNDGNTWTSGTMDISLTVGEFYTEEDRNVIDEYDEYVEPFWDQKVQPSTTQLESVIWDGQRFIAVGKWSKRFNVKDGSFPRTWKGSIICTSDDGTHWNVKQFDSLNHQGKLGLQTPTKIIFTGSAYVVAAGSVVSTSSGLDTWTYSVPDKLILLNDLVYVNEKYIAVGYYPIASWTGKKGGTSAVFTSNDGVEWEISKDSLSTSLQSIVWDGNQYIFAANLRNIVKSKDLEKWQTISNEVADKNINLQSFINNPETNKLIYDGKQYIAVGAYGSILFRDKIEDNYWNVARERPYANFDNIVTDGSNRYVASSNVRSNTIRFAPWDPYAAFRSLWESEDGYNWRPVQMIGPATPHMHWDSMVAANGTVLAFGRDGSDGTEHVGYALSQKPGQWEFKKFPVDLGENVDLFWLNNEFYAMGNDTYITSKDGVTWSALGTFYPSMKNILTNGNIQIGVKQKDNRLYSSSDNASWEALDTQFSEGGYNNSVKELIWNGSQFAAIGSFAAVSIDGENWTFNKIDTSLGKLAGNSEQYIATSMGRNDEYNFNTHYKRLYTSSNGLHYSPLAKLTDYSLNGIVWDGEKFIVAGDRGTILIGKPASLIRVMVDGHKLKLEKMPVIIDGTTMLPVRDIFNAVGANVTWDDATKTATGIKEGHTIKLTLNSTNALVDGKSVALSVPAQVVDNKLMVPSRFVAEAFGYEVTWDNSTRTVHIATKKEVNTSPKEAESSKDSSQAKEKTKESSKPNESAPSSGSATQPTDSLDYVMEKATDAAKRTYFNVKDKNNRTILRYYKSDSSNHTIMVDYTGEKDDYKFKFAQAVIEKEKGTASLSGLSEELTKAAHNNKQLNGMSPTIPLSINGTKVEYLIIHSEGSPLYSIEIDF